MNLTMWELTAKNLDIKLRAAEAQIAELEEALRPLVAGEAFGLRCNYCRAFDSTLGKLHSESCPVVIGRKVLNHE